MDNSETLTVLSLCTGYGGLELGLSQAIQNPMRVVAVEIEAFALATLAKKAEERKLAIEALWPNLKTFPAEKFRGCFDFLLAGYPCQPFSSAGKRKGADDPRHLFPYIAKIIEQTAPDWVFLENVAGHLTLGFPAVYRSLREMGYVVEAGLFTAAECGGVFEGLRLFILATTNRNGIFCRTNQCHMARQGTLRKWCKTKYRPCTLLQKTWARRPCDINAISRATDESSHRVDRLRLLGNGVVPRQAAKAFIHLYDKLMCDLRYDNIGARIKYGK